LCRLDSGVVIFRLRIAMPNLTFGLTIANIWTSQMPSFLIFTGTLTLAAGLLHATQVHRAARYCSWIRGRCIVVDAAIPSDRTCTAELGLLLDMLKHGFLVKHSRRACGDWAARFGFVIVVWNIVTSCRDFDIPELPDFCRCSNCLAEWLRTAMSELQVMSRHRCISGN
jgi:hypothetical protein